MFFMIAAILYFLRTAESPKWKNAALLGISAALMSAARGEGMALSAALLLGLPIYAGLFCRPTAWKKLIASWVIAIICTAATISPFCAMNYSRSGYFVPDVRIVALIDPQAVAPADTAENQEEKFVYQSSMQQMTAGEKCYHNLSSFIRGGYELYWVLAIIGAVAIFRRKQFKPDYLLFAGAALLYFLLYMLTVSAYRYYLFMIPLFMMFTVTGANVLRELAEKHLPGKLQMICLALCAALAIGQFVNGINRTFSSQGKDFIKAGKWIEKYNKDHFPDRKLKLFSPLMSEVGYWSKAELTEGFEKRPHNPATFKDFDLAVVHRKRSFGLEKRSDLERLENTPHSKNIWIFKVRKQENK